MNNVTALLRVQVLPELPVERHGADGPPPLVQAAAGLLQRVTLGLGEARRVLVLQQYVAQAEDGSHALRVLLDVPLQLLDGHAGGWTDGQMDTKTGLDTKPQAEHLPPRVRPALPKIKQRTDVNY